MQLKNISKHRPNNMIIDVAEKDAKAIIKTGEFIESIKENLIVLNKPEIEFIEEKDDGRETNIPDESWTEKEIDKWVEINAPEITYNPTKHTKKYILDKLNEKNII